MNRGALWQLWVVFVLLMFGCKSAPVALKYQTIQESAAHGDIKDVENHLSRGVAVNATDKDGLTALMAAAFEGEVSVADFLLSKGADVNMRRGDGDDAICRAAAGASGDREDGSEKKGEPGSHFKIVRKLIEKGADAKASACLAVIKDADIDLAQFLMDKGAQPTTEYGGTSALFRAALYAKPKVLKLMLDRGADPNSIHLIDSPSSLCVEGDTLLHTVARHMPGEDGPAAECVISLIAKGAMVNAKNGKGETPINVLLYCDGNCPLRKLLQDAQQRSN